jgi:hypothetical protein
MPEDVVERIRRALALPGAPVVVQGLGVTAAFFHDTLREDPLRWLDYLRGIDFHAPVRVRFLSSGSRLSRHRGTGAARDKPFVYFTVPGTSPFRTGTSFPESMFELFECTAPVNALESRASSISFGPTDRTSRAGGGTQYIIAVSAMSSLRRVR